MRVDSESRGTSPWVWIGCGCGVFLLLLALAVGGLGFLGYRGIQQIEKDMKDPVARALRAKEILGAERLPAGYHPILGISIPFFMDLAILSDREPEEDGKNEDLGDRGFLFVAIRAFGEPEQDLRDFFDGKKDRSEVVSEHIDVEFEEELADGELQIAGDHWRWIAFRGRIDTGERREHPAIASMMMLECGEEKRLRFALWFVPDPASEQDVLELDLSGTPADEEALTAFLSHFHPCSDSTSRATDP